MAPARQYELPLAAPPTECDTLSEISSIHENSANTRPPPIPVERLKQLFYFDGDGQLRWRPRNVRSRTDKSFNGNFANKLAGTKRAAVWVDGRQYPIRRIIEALRSRTWPSGRKPVLKHDYPVSIERLKALLTVDSNGQLRWLPRSDNAQWTNRFAGKPATRPNAYGNHYLTIDRHMYPARRVVAALNDGAWPRQQNTPQRGEPLSVERLRELLAYEPDTGNVVWRERPEGTRAANRANTLLAGTGAGHTNRYGYRTVIIQKKQYLAHRIAWALAFGHWPTNPIDHRNGIRDDNRLENLRAASPKLNGANRGPTKNRPLPKGVHLRGERYAAVIRVSGKSEYLGTFDTVDAATNAYHIAARAAWGEFANTNVRSTHAATHR